MRPRGASVSRFSVNISVMCSNGKVEVQLNFSQFQALHQQQLEQIPPVHWKSLQDKLFEEVRALLCVSCIVGSNVSS